MSRRTNRNPPRRQQPPHPSKTRFQKHALSVLKPSRPRIPRFLDTDAYTFSRFEWRPRPDSRHPTSARWHLGPARCPSRALISLVPRTVASWRAHDPCAVSRPPVCSAHRKQCPAGFPAQMAVFYTDIYGARCRTQLSFAPVTTDRLVAFCLRHAGAAGVGADGVVPDSRRAARSS